VNGVGIGDNHNAYKLSDVNSIEKLFNLKLKPGGGWHYRMLTHSSIIHTDMQTSKQHKKSKPFYTYFLNCQGGLNPKPQPESHENFKMKSPEARIVL